jgi:hypothetical protein
MTERRSLHQRCVLAKIFSHAFQKDEQLCDEEKLDISAVEQQ